MITLYELKHNPGFRCCYKAPYYIKNLFLMIVLAIALFVIYVVYFRADGGHYTNVLNIIRGLNSQTFNYLEANSKFDLGLDWNTLPQYNASEDSIDTVLFTSECLRTNRPCVFRDLAKHWPATRNWRYAVDQGEYLSTLLEDIKVRTYTKTTVQMPGIPSRAYSFT